MTRPAVEVCFTPREIRPADVAVVVDVSSRNQLDRALPTRPSIALSS